MTKATYPCPVCGYRSIVLAGTPTNSCPKHGVFDMKLALTEPVRNAAKKAKAKPPSMRKGATV